MKIVTWNVNGLRAAWKKGFPDWLERSRPSILGLQEVRARPEQLPEEARAPRGWHVFHNPAERPGYSGTMLWSKRRPQTVRTQLGVPEFDAEGRVQIAEFDRFVFFNVYFPNGSGKDRDNGRVPFKLAFYRRVLEEVEVYRERGCQVIIAGDWNTAHREIDLTNWRQNRTTSGFLPEERAEVDRWLATGLRDVYRERVGDEPGHHTWWSQRGGARARNVGWRIDWLLVTPDLVPAVRRVWLEPQVMASDHCPAGLDLVLPRDSTRS